MIALPDNFLELTEAEQDAFIEAALISVAEEHGIDTHKPKPVAPRLRSFRIAGDLS